MLNVFITQHYIMFVRTKKRAFPSQIPSVRRSRPNIKAKRINQFLDDLREDNPIEEEPENNGFFNLEDDVSILSSSDDIVDDNNDILPQTEDDSDNNYDSLSQTEDDSDNNYNSLPQTEGKSENGGFFKLEDDIFNLE